MRYEDYIQFDYSPSKNDVVVEFLVEPSKNAGAVAAESSIGTWTEVKTFKRNLKKLAAKVFEIKGNKVKIAYPSELFEPG
ncbi:MAG: ribulose-bisphosphate carboxylase large subunit, partial [Nanoarchaeota archaeon]|nr:ribulose-bisphosphate carboxylase large subunit [Nanoarchaeota archaeon]